MEYSIYSPCDYSNIPMTIDNCKGVAALKGLSRT
jgi:hypothetical protein